MTASLIIPVGVPGCGKSTYARMFFMEPNDVILSTDAIRASPAFGADVTNQDNNDAVFQYFHDQVVKGFVRGNRVFADATNLTYRARETLRDLTQSVVPIHLVIFANPDEAVARNQQRDRVVPEHVMTRMLDNYERFRLDLPSEAHLYDTITEIRSFS